MQPLKNCIGPTIHIDREILCLPYAGFFEKNDFVQFHPLIWAFHLAI